MKYLLMSLLLLSAAFSQTKMTSKPETLAKRYADAVGRADQAEADKRALEMTIGQRDATITSLNNKADDLQKRLDGLQGSFDSVISLNKESLAFNQRLLDSYGKVGQEHAVLVDKFNDLLSFAHRQADINSELSHNLRMQNALAIYSFLPKFTPVQTPPTPRMYQSPNIHCTSTSLGDTTNTNCN